MLCNAWVSVIFQDTDRGRRSGSWRDWRSAMALKDSVSEVSPFCLPSSVGRRPTIQLAMKKRFRSGYRTNRNHREGPGNWWPQALTARAKVRTAAPDPYLDMLHAALNALNFCTEDKIRYSGSIIFVIGSFAVIVDSTNGIKRNCIYAVVSTI